MAYQEIAYDVADGVLRLTLDRPEHMNACTIPMLYEIIGAIDEAEADDAVKVIVVTGRGRAFCAGADLGSGGDTFNPDVQEGIHRVDGIERDPGGLIALRLFDFRKPVIAAINGAAVGIGATMTLPMDVRLASDTAKFGFVFTRRGIVPETCSSWFLPRLVGMGKAMEWVLTGRVFGAAEALAAGLVQHVVPAADLPGAARDLALELAATTAPVSVALARQLLWKGLTIDHPMEAHRLESLAMMERSRSDDVKEGVASFLEKRPAAFTMSPSADMPAFYPWWDERPFGAAGT